MVKGGCWCCCWVVIWVKGEGLDQLAGVKGDGGMVMGEG